MRLYFKRDGWKIKVSTLIKFEIYKGIPRLVIHEKFKNIITWTLRILTFIGIATSLLSISEWYYSLGLSVVIILIEQFFERVLFEYTTFYISNFPEFNFQPQSWLTNAYKIPIQYDVIGFWGPVFDTKEYACKVFEYLISSIGSNQDTENQVKNTIVLANEHFYHIFYYEPSKEKLNKGFKYLEEQSRYEKKGKRQQEFVVVYSFMKKLNQNKFLNNFIEYFESRNDVIFVPSYQTEKGKHEMIHELGIKINKINIITIQNLDKNSLEYSLVENYLK